MDVVVVGGSVAGLKAACRIARLQPDARIRVLVKDDYFGYSLCGLPYYLSGDIASLEMLATTPNGTLRDRTYFRDVKGIEVLPRHEVFAIDRAARYVRCRIPDGDREATFPYDNRNQTRDRHLPRISCPGGSKNLFVRRILRSHRTSSSVWLEQA